MPEPRGHGFIMRAKVDADHASDTVSRRSRTGLLIPLLTPLIDPNWINSELAIALVKIFKIFLY